MGLSAAALHARAVDLCAHGRYPDARRALQRADLLTDDPDLHARIEGTRAHILERTGDPVGAERTCRAALRIDGITVATTAVLTGQLGMLAMYGGRFAEAESLLTSAIDDTVEHTELANMRMNRALARMYLGLLDGADHDLRDAAEQYGRVGTALDVAQARHNLGYVALLRGDIVEAMAEMSAARGPIAAASPVNAAVSDIDMAEVLRDAGLVTQGERLLAAAARVFGAHRMPQPRAEAEFQLARSQLVHDPRRAARTAASAARRFRALGAASWAARADGVRLRALLAGGAIDRHGLPVAGVGRPPSPAAVAATAGELRRHRMTGDADAVRLTHQLWRARRGAPTERVRVAAGAPLEVRLLAHEVRATRAAVAGREREARRHAGRGLDELIAWRGSFGSIDLQASAAMHGSGLVLAGIGAAVRSGRPDAVFEWSERARHLSQHVVPLRPPPDPEQAADLAELRRLRLDLPAGQWMADPRAAALGERVRQRQWSATGAARHERRHDLAAVHEALDADTALLSYVFGPHGLACLVATRDDARIVELPGWAAARDELPGLRADLEMAATVRTGPLAGVVAHALATRLDALSRALVDPPLQATAARRIVITVPGVLTGVPWSMLPGMRGRSSTLAPSASRWVRERGAPVTVTACGFAVGPRVARGEEEVRRAAAHWADARVLSDPHARVDAVADLASDVDLLHVAAHGRHAVDNPLFSGLELADGALFGYDIDRMHRVPSVVVLSACEVGRSSVRWGEEAVGMTRAWLHAGVRCVVAAPVVVADDEAGELLSAMHEGLAVGAPAADALAAAAERTGIRAPFQCHGSGF
ncbi:CHAT domain-containing protein [Microbacterium sp. Sa4CUA7]|uniref:CHAT domain-containing protein n=1 Tax=Microbacterium pullorum TaxID=2762236 RepID=A0ABR8S423_9MICO|nr:CHAT domain-containing protein [Microbacterium pullorum]MBD7958208.1 CHAT domain-containing protein [Microbacterium pullorum]